MVVVARCNGDFLSLYIWVMMLDAAMLSCKRKEITNGLIVSFDFFLVLLCKIAREFILPCKAGFEECITCVVHARRHVAA